jgi:hypothetical protein
LASADLVDATKDDYFRKAEKAASILLERCGPRSATEGIGNPIEDTVAAEIARL